VGIPTGDRGSTPIRTRERDLSTRQVGLGIFLTLTGVIGFTHQASATLGGDVASVAVNQRHLSSTRRVRSLNGGECHDLHLPSGPVVHEYLSPAGVVYAVSWKGHGMPDLRELLGAYFSQMPTSHRRGGHHRMTLTGDDLVVESTSHGHLFTGRAWVPSLVPAGVDVAATVGNEP
jgi:hypothetical protein